MVWAFGNRTTALRRVRRAREAGRDQHASRAKSWRSYRNKRSRWVGGRNAVTVTDVRLDAMAAARYYGCLTIMTIDFLASGMSWGGVIAQTHRGVGYEVRVNWLTGGVDVVPHRPL